MNNQTDALSYNQLLHTYSELEIESAKAEDRANQAEFMLKQVRYERDVALAEKRDLKDRLRLKSELLDTLQKHEENNRRLQEALSLTFQIWEDSEYDNLYNIYALLKVSWEAYDEVRQAIPSADSIVLLYTPSELQPNRNDEIPF